MLRRAKFTLELDISGVIRSLLANKYFEVSGYVLYVTKHRPSLSMNYA